MTERQKWLIGLCAVALVTASALLVGGYITSAEWFQSLGLILKTGAGA